MGRSRAGDDTDSVAAASPWESVVVAAPARRTATGIVVLALALFALAVVPALLSGGIVGDATRAPLPLPPLVGSCVLLPAVDATEPVRVVSCAEPHDGEITMNWAPGTPPQANGGAEPNAYSYSAAGRSSRFTYFQCFGWNSDYVGSSAGLPDQWSYPSPLYTGGLIYGSSVQQYDPLYWSACVVVPAIGVGPYDGTVRGAGARVGQARPPIYQSCLARPEFGSVELTYTNCGLPHRVEPIALDGDVDAQVPPDQALADCRQVVSMVTGAADPTYGGQLSVKVQAVGMRTLNESDTVAALTQTHDGQAQDCVVELAGDGALTGSVVGLGDAPLPLAR